MASARRMGERFGVHLQKTIENNEKPANIGFLLSNGRYSVRGDDSNIKLLPNNKCYVRLLGEDAQTQVALVGMVTPWPDAPVFVKRNFRGELFISSMDWSRAWEYLGELMNDFATPPSSGATLNVFPASNIMDGRLLWGVKTGLTVKAQAFYYPYLDSKKYWDGNTALNLADYLPSASSQWGWVVVCIDPKDNSITAQISGEYPLKGLLTTAVLLGVDTSGLIPVAGVTVQEGQTAYNSAKNTITYLPEFRNYGSPVVEKTYGTGLIGASRQAVVTGMATVTGMLGVKGELIAA